LACATVSTVPPERGELLPTEAPTEPSAEDANLVKLAIAEVDRYRSMDRLIPSSHNVVTIAVLEVRTESDTLIPSRYLSSTHTVLSCPYPCELGSQQSSHLLPSDSVSHIRYMIQTATHREFQ
jgi:hypothetical protein